MRPPARADERGFVLIGVVWLLLLATALVAALLLRARAASQKFEGEIKLAQDRLDHDAATETVVADLAIRGGASRWSTLPAHDIVMIGDRGIDVSVASEAAKLDLNVAEASVIAGVLQGLGVSPRQREAVLARLARARAFGRIETTAAADAVFSSLEGTQLSAPCWERSFSLASGAVAIRPQAGSPDAPGANVVPFPDPAPIRPGELLRITTINPVGARSERLLRLIASDGKVGFTSEYRLGRC